MMVDKDELIDLLAKTTKLGLEILPDSEEYEKVKEVRTQLSIALEVYKVFREKNK